MHEASRAELVRRIVGYTLLVAGGVTILAALPLWVWVGLLGAGCVAVGWFLVGRK